MSHIVKSKFMDYGIFNHIVSVLDKEEAKYSVKPEFDWSSNDMCHLTDRRVYIFKFEDAFVAHKFACQYDDLLETTPEQAFKGVKDD